MQLLPSLVKITLFSSAVHQIAFTWNSGLNFAIGQVQDAGLIFLSSMAANIAEFMLDSGNHNTKAIVSTALFVLSLYTALMGLVLIVIGRLRLASVIQYLPMPGNIFPSFYCCHERLYTCLCCCLPYRNHISYISSCDTNNSYITHPSLLTYQCTSGGWLPSVHRVLLRSGGSRDDEWSRLADSQRLAQIGHQPKRLRPHVTRFVLWRVDICAANLYA